MKIISKIMLLLTAVIFINCSEMPPEIRQTLIKICSPLCKKVAGGPFALEEIANGFGCTFYYNCRCYQKEGLAEPISIKVERRKVLDLMKEKYND